MVRLMCLVFVRLAGWMALLARSARRPKNASRRFRVAEVSAKSAPPNRQISYHLSRKPQSSAIIVAFACVYLRSGSGLEQFTEAVTRPEPSEGPLHDAYTRYRR